MEFESYCQIEYKDLPLMGLGAYLDAAGPELIRVFGYPQDYSGGDGKSRWTWSIRIIRKSKVDIVFGIYDWKEMITPFEKYRDWHISVREEDLDLVMQFLFQNLKDIKVRAFIKVRKDVPKLKMVKHEIIVCVEGGVIQDIRDIPKNIRIKVIDSDTDGVSEKDLSEFEGDKVIISEWEA